MTINNILLALTIVLVLLLAFILLVPRFFPGLNARMGKFAGETYQKRLFKQIQKKYPALWERVQGYELSAESQDAFQNSMKKLPPQEGMKLQAEFNRLRDNFMTKHPEVAPLINAGQDGKAQSQAFNTLMKLPDDKRQALEKDLIWAWDQLRRNSPKAMGQLESAFRKKGQPQVESGK